MSARLRGIARETEAIVLAGRYRTPEGREVTIERALATALPATRLYGPEPVPVAVPDTDRTPVVEVTDETSLQAARRMTGESAAEVAVLNYASARNPGGGYLNGAQAQEESLCRGSALHATLLRAPEFYAHHRAERSALYTDRVIHSPGVPVFRDDRGDCSTPRTRPDSSPRPRRTPESSAEGTPTSSPAYPPHWRAGPNACSRSPPSAATGGWCWARGAAESS